MIGLVVSTVVFFIAAWFISRFLDEQGLPKGMTRSTLVFLLASLMSWGTGALVGWVQGSDQAPHTSADTTRLLHEAGQPQP